MDSTLYIRAHHGGRIDYQFSVAGHTTIGSAFHPDQLPELPTEYQTIVFIPGQEVITVTINLPKMAKFQLAKAIPFALEDNIIDDIEDCHFAFNPQTENGDVVVYVINAEQLAQRLQGVKQLNLSIHQVMPDYLCLPYQTDAWHGFITDQHLLVRLSENVGYGFEQQLQTVILNDLASNHPQRQLIINYDDNNENVQASEFELSAISVELAKSPTVLISLLAEQYQQQRPRLNLLTGVFSRYGVVAKRNNYWRWMLATAVFSVCVWLVSNGVQLLTYRHNQQQLQQAITQQYQQVFPNQQPTDNVKTLINQQLQQRQLSANGDQFLQYLRAITKAWQKIGHLLTIDSITYDNQRLRLVVTADKFKTLSTYLETLQQQGVMAKQQNATTANNQVMATIVIGDQ